MPIKTASAKAKGRNLQKWVASQIAALFGLEVNNYDDDPVKSRPMGQAGVDVIIERDLRARFPFGVECKAGKSIGWQAAMRQAKEGAKKGGYPNWMVVMKQDRQKPVVMLDAETFFNLFNVR